ncbi:MAG TPA: hypothetical protein VLX85_05090 [Stellaceae bacterium]|nr:hypothetical protein [Stellaceae bacterium]
MFAAAKTPAARHLWQDLLRDWRRWSAIERVLATTLVAALASLPLLSLAAFAHSAA